MTQPELVKQIMTHKLVTVQLEDSIQKAYEILRERKIRHLPVRDDAGGMIGILSDRDLQRAMKPHKLSMDVTENDQDIEFNPHYKVKDFMSWPVNCVEQTVQIADAARRMVNQKISALLVVDEQKVPRGIITTEDMLKLLIRLLENSPSGIKLSFEDIMSEWKWSTGHWA